MKNFFIILFMSIALSASVSAESVQVKLNDGHIIEGKLISYNDSILFIEPNTLVKYAQKLKAENVTFFVIDNYKHVISQDGKFSAYEKGSENANNVGSESPLTSEDGIFNATAYNPNVVIGNAFKSTSRVAWAIGIPALIAGGVLTAVGHVSNNSASLNTIETRGRCAEAGYVLLPIGASLTIIGIPLYIHGKRIAEMDFNYTGTGAGVSVNF